MNKPLDLLRECRDSKLRVKILSCNGDGERGALHATVVAFDSSWNLTLINVLEVWKMNRYSSIRIVPALHEPIPQTNVATVDRPETQTMLDADTILFTRFASRMKLRGQKIILINVNRD